LRHCCCWWNCWKSKESAEKILTCLFWWNKNKRRQSIE
jgi:hypothetical protein